MAQKLDFNKNDGIKEYCFADDENAIIRINTRDINLLVRMEEGKKQLKEFANSLKNVENETDDVIFNKLDELDKKVKETIDWIFDSEVSKTAFGNTSSVTIIDGEPRFVTFTNALIPVVEKEIEKEHEEANGKIESYVTQAKAFK